MRKRTPKRPRPFQVGPVRVRAIRGPREDGTWYFRCERYEGGSSKTIWTGWSTKEDVTRILAGLVADGREDEPQGRQRDRVETVKDLLEVWLPAQLGREKIRPSTKCNNVKNCRHLASELGNVLLTRLNNQALERYQSTRLKQGAATGTVSNEISNLIQAWRWAKEDGLVPDREIKRPDLKQEPKLSRYIPDPVEFWKVFDVMPKGRPWTRTMLLMMEGTGARPGEVAHLSWENINLDRGIVLMGA